MSQEVKTNPADKIRLHQTRKAIFRKLYQLLKANPTLTEEQALSKMEAETASLFEQLTTPRAPLPDTTGKPDMPMKPRTRRRASHQDRTEHVGRFFIHIMEKQLREAGIQSCVIPVFARSVPVLIGDEAYEKFSNKITHLIEFANSKGFSYDQILASKPGQEIMKEIVQLYRQEMETTPAFEDKLRNRLDEALVSFSVKQEDDDFNIEDAIEQSYTAFIKLISKPGKN